MSAYWQNTSNAGKGEGEYKAEDVNFHRAQKKNCCYRWPGYCGFKLQITLNCKNIHSKPWSRIPRMAVNKEHPVPLYAMANVGGSLKSWLGKCCMSGLMS